MWEVFLLKIGRIFSLLSDSNINKDEVFKLVDRIKQMDLDDEENLRSVIKQAAVVANRNLSPELEEELVKKIQREGLTANLLDYL